MLADKGMKLDAVVEITADADTLVGARRQARQGNRRRARRRQRGSASASASTSIASRPRRWSSYYRGKGLLKSVDGMAPVEDVTAAIRRAVHD